MAEPLIAPMPPECTLDNGCKVQFVAISPTDGSTITGVTVSNANIYVEAKNAGDLSSGSFKLLNPVLVVRQA